MRRIALLAACAVVLLVPGFAVSGGAQSKSRFLDKDTFMDMETISNPAIAPDGGQIVFSRGWIDKVKDQARSNIWIVDVGGTKLRELTRGSWRDSAPAWSPDSSKIAFLSDRDGTTQIHVLFVATGDLAQLTHVERTPGSLAWSPDGRQIAFTTTVLNEDPILPIQLPKRPRGAEWAKGATIVDRLAWARDGEGPVEKGDAHVFIVDAIAGGTPRQITDGTFNHANPEWSADARTIYVSGIRKPEAEYLNNDSEIYAIDLGTMAVTALTDRKGPDGNPTDGAQVLNGLSLAANGQAATARSTPLEPGQLVTFNVKSPAQRKTLVDVNSDVLAGRALGDVEELWFASKDGLKIQGWLVKPVDFQPGKKYPLVLWIHGGPSSMYDVGFNWGYQNFAGLGYAVLYTNPRGSTGYGQDFVNGIQFSYPGKDYDDLMAGVDAAVAPALAATLPAGLVREVPPALNGRLRSGAAAAPGCGSCRRSAPPAATRTQRFQRRSRIAVFQLVQHRRRELDTSGAAATAYERAVLSCL